MSVGHVIAELREKGVQIWADGDRLRCEAPSGILTPELKNLLLQNKTELLEFLGSVQHPRDQKSLVPLQTYHGGVPIFGVPGHNGDVFCYRALSEHLGSHQPFFGLQPPGLYDGETPLSKVEEIGAHFASQIQRTTSQPVIIAGFCAGGAIAFELARQLQGADVSVLLLALFGSPHPVFFRPRNRIRERVMRNLRRASSDVGGLREAAYQAVSRTTHRLMNMSRPPSMETDEDQVLAHRARVEQATVSAVSRYKPGTFSGRTALFLPSTSWAAARYYARSWHEHAPCCDEYVGPEGCDGDNMLRDEKVPIFSVMFSNAIERAALQPASVQK